MRLIVFFDLPMNSKKERKIYHDFHKWLIKNGYIMMQYSIYTKIFNNRDACVNHIPIIKRNVPKQGQIRLMMITEKQYTNIEIIVGGASNQEQKSTTDPFVIL